METADYTEGVLHRSSQDVHLEVEDPPDVQGLPSRGKSNRS